MKVTMISSLLLLLASCQAGSEGGVIGGEGTVAPDDVEEVTVARHTMTLRAFKVDGGRYVLSDGMGTILTDGGFTFKDGMDYAVSFNDNSGTVLAVEGTGVITDVEALEALTDKDLVDEIKIYGMGL